MHTPEPWGVIGTNPVVLQLNTREILARVYHSKKLDDCVDPVDNARLMAAAPSLLQACQIALDREDGLKPEDIEDDEDSNEEARAAGCADADEYRWLLADEGFRRLLKSAIEDAGY